MTTARRCRQVGSPPEEDVWTQASLSSSRRSRTDIIYPKDRGIRDALEAVMEMGILRTAEFREQSLLKFVSNLCRRIGIRSRS